MSYNPVMTTIVLSPKDSINEALSSSPQGPLTIILEGGVWNEKVYVERSDVTLLSEEGAVIRYGLSHGDEIDGKIINTGDSATLTVAAPSFSALGVTIENSFPWPEEFRHNEENPEGEKKDLQAVALRIAFGAGNSTFRSCSINGWQDTLYIDYGLSSFEDCTISGAVDFIFGSGTALFQGCEIRSRARGFVTAPSTYDSDDIGFVFHDCTFVRNDDVGDETVFLARPWYPSGSTNRRPMALFIDPELGGHINPLLWTDMTQRMENGEKIVHKGTEQRFYITKEDSENIKAEDAENILSSLISRFK